MCVHGCPLKNMTPVINHVICSINVIATKLRSMVFWIITPRSSERVRTFPKILSPPSSWSKIQLMKIPTEAGAKLN